MDRANDRPVSRGSTRPFAAALTLHDLVDALCDSGANDRQVVAAVVDLLRTSRVRLARRVEELHSARR